MSSKRIVSDEILLALSPIFDSQPESNEDVSDLGNDLYIIRRPFEKGHKIKQWTSHIRNHLNSMDCVYQIMDAGFARTSKETSWTYAEIKIIL